MKDFHFTTEREQAEIEKILLQRKKKQSKQQALFMAIFICIIIVIALYCVRKILYAEFNGYVVVHNVRFRASEDIFVHDIYKHNGDLVKPGDTIYSYVSLDWFHEIGNINTESEIVVKSRDLKVQYGLAYQNLAVLRAKMTELQRQIDLEDHNIRFGLSDNVHKLQLEREYKETDEELKALQRRLHVLRIYHTECAQQAEDEGTESCTLYHSCRLGIGDTQLDFRAFARIAWRGHHRDTILRPGKRQCIHYGIRYSRQS